MWWQKYIGRPFEEKGRGPNSFDCWGLVRWVYGYDHPDKIELPSYDECYKSTQDREKLSSVILTESNIKWFPTDGPKTFDVILLRMRGFPMHVGVVTKPFHMLHCSQGIGTVHERFDSMRWEKKVLGFFRYE